MKFGGISPDGPPRQLSDRIAKLLKGGCSLKDACMVAGIHPQTLRRWMRKGEYLKGDRNHRYCYEVVTIAQGKCKAKMIQRVVAADDWKAAAHWLKQNHPDEWGDKKTVAIEDKRIASMDKLTLLKELRDQQELLEESIEAEGTEVPGREQLPPEAEHFALAAEAGLFEEEPAEPEPSPLPRDENGFIPEGARAKLRLYAEQSEPDED